MRFDPDRPLVIGTRGSPLALAQARETRARLSRALDLPQAAFSISVIETTGDRVQDRSLGDIGGKGLFTKEIDRALASQQIDIAVHSMKDVPTQRPGAFTLACTLPREDVRDAFLSRSVRHLRDLPMGATLGSSSLRRRAQVRLLRPDLKLVEFRGNVQTRLRKLDEGIADATFLAMAGLNRLCRADAAASCIDTGDMLPAVAQGAIGIECLTSDADLRAALAKIDHPDTGTQIAAERAFLFGLDGSCQTPIAALATLTGAQLLLTGQVLRPDGSEEISGTLEGTRADAAQLGSALAAQIKSQMGAGFFDQA